MKKNARKPKAQDLNSKFGAAENKSKSNSKLHIYNFFNFSEDGFKAKKKTEKFVEKREKSPHAAPDERKKGRRTNSGPRKDPREI